MDPIGSVGSATTPPAPVTAATQALGKDDFLKLLTAQLSNQDPLQPVDNQAFIAQLSQFSSLEQLQGVSARLDTLILATSSETQLGTASLVGKTISYHGDGDATGQPLRTGQVRGVDLSGAEPRLLVGDTSVKLSDVVQVTAP